MYLNKMVNHLKSSGISTTFLLSKSPPKINLTNLSEPLKIYDYVRIYLPTKNKRHRRFNKKAVLWSFTKYTNAVKRQITKPIKDSVLVKIDASTTPISRQISTPKLSRTSLNMVIKIYTMMSEINPKP